MTSIKFNNFYDDSLDFYMERELERSELRRIQQEEEEERLAEEFIEAAMKDANGTEYKVTYETLFCDHWEQLNPIMEDIFLSKAPKDRESAVEELVSLFKDVAASISYQLDRK